MRAERSPWGYCKECFNELGELDDECLELCEDCADWVFAGSYADGETET